MQVTNSIFAPLKDQASKIPMQKTRNKKQKDEVDYDILQLDVKIRLLFEREMEKIPYYKSRIISMLQSINSIKPPFGIDEEIKKDISLIYEYYCINEIKRRDEKTEEKETTKSIESTESLKMSNSTDPLDPTESIESMELTEKTNAIEPDEKSKGRELRKKYNILDMPYNEYIEYYNKIKKTILRLENIESGKLYEKYIELTGGIIEEYKSILAKPITVSFLKRPKKTKKILDMNGETNSASALVSVSTSASASDLETNDSNEDKGEGYMLKRKKDLKIQYLQIAKEFINIDIPCQNTQDNIYKCECGNVKDFDSNDSLSICKICGYEIPIVSVHTNFKDHERINLHQKYRYEKRSHFKDGVLQFQGKQNKYIDPSLYEKADEWLSIHGLLTGISDDEQDGLPAKKKKYSKVKKEHIRLFMSESSEKAITDHYEDVNLIYSNLTGTPCPDISKLEDKLYEQFDKLVEAFLSSTDIERTNFLNTSFVLKKLLLMNGYKIDNQDFPGLKTASRLNEHEEIFDKLCQVVGFNNP